MVGGRERFGWGRGGWLVVVVEIEVEVVGSTSMSVLMRCVSRERYRVHSLDAF
jgi:hypothetical protein